jgi:multidrug efflux pump subunit AcrA (membrane-fusion protein)
MVSVKNLKQEQKADLTKFKHEQSLARKRAVDTAPAKERKAVKASLLAEYREALTQLKAQQAQTLAQARTAKQAERSSSSTRALSLRIPIAVLEQVRQRVGENGETSASFVERAVLRLASDQKDAQNMDLSLPADLWWQQEERRMWTIHLPQGVVGTIEELAPWLCMNITSWLTLAMIREIEFGRQEEIA